MRDETKGNLIGLLFVAVIAAIGIYVVLIGLGKLGRSPHGAPGWVIVVAGAAFLFAAASTGMNALAYFTTGAKAKADGSLDSTAPYPIRAIQLLLSLIVVALLATVATWVAFNPGDGPDNSRNVAFAVGAAIVWIIFLGFAWLALKRLAR